MTIASAGARVVDLNADLGEGFGVWSLGDDDALLDLVTSANVACGYHAGDASTMRRVCARAAERGVAVGAHVSYRDLHGFGRRFVDAAPEELRDDVLYQIAALHGIATAEGTAVSYVKPHGALYNAIDRNETQAAAVVAAVVDFRPGLTVLGLPGSAWLRRAEQAGLVPATEAFADRAYQPDGTLVPRRLPDAVLHDPDLIVARVVRMVTLGIVTASDGSDIAVSPASVCVHGDTPGATEIARSVRAGLQAAGIHLRRVAP